MGFRIGPRLAGVTAAAMGTWLGFTAPTQAALSSPAATAYVVGGTVLGITIPQTPLSTFPPGGTTSTVINIAPVASSGTATATTAGSVANGTSSASATVQQLGVNLGAVGNLGFTGVNSTCDAPAAPTTPTGNGLIATAGLTVLGITTNINIPTGINSTPVNVVGVGSIAFNKQTTDANNVLTVVAAEVTLIGGNVLDIGVAQCGGAPATAPTPMVYPPAAAGGLTLAAVMGFVYLRRRRQGSVSVEV